MTICKCGSQCGDEDNFCGECAAKLHEVCPKCQWSDNQPNRCYGDMCQGPFPDRSFSRPSSDHYLQH